MKTRFVSASLIFLCFLFAPLSVAKELSPLLRSQMLFENYNTSHGLSQVSINAIAEDEQGFIWVATQSGLNRFDGYQFRNYKSRKGTNSLPSNFLTHITVDKNTLWIGTQLTGVSAYDKNTDTFTHYGHEPNNTNTVSDNFVHVIHRDSADNIWIGNQNGLDLWHPASNSFIRFNERFSELKGLPVQAIEEGNASTLWLGTQQGLFMLDIVNNTLTPVALPKLKSAQSNNINVLSLHLDKANALWVGTNAGLYKISSYRDPGTQQKQVNINTDFQLYAKDFNQAQYLSVNDLKSNAQNDLWLATETQGICELRNNEFVIRCQTANPNNPMALQSNSVQSIHFDKRGELWVGTAASGLGKYVQNSKNFTTVRQGLMSQGGLSGKIIFAIEGDEEKLWLGSLTKGITEYDRKTGEANYYLAEEDNDQSIKENGVAGLFKEGEHLWIGYRNVTGMTRLNLVTQEYQHYEFYHKADLSPLRVRKIMRSHSGKLLLVGPDSGLISFDTHTGDYEHFYHQPNNPKSIPSSYMFNLEQSTDFIWLSADNGLIRFDEKSQTFTHFIIPAEDNIEATNYLFDVHVSSDEDIWIGSLNGFHHLSTQTGNFTSYYAKDGLPNVEVDNVMTDNEGHLWLATNNGLSYFNKETKRFESYFVEDGIQHNEHAVGAKFKDDEGKIYFGGVEGFTFFNPNTFLRLNRDIQPKITALYVGNKEITQDNDPYGLLPKPIYDIKELTFSAAQATLFAFAFSANDYLAPQKIHYQYKMQGLINEWVDVSTDRRQVSFTGLSPGSYQLMLRARYPGSQWSDKTQSLLINITPPMWQSWWAYTLYALLILLYINRYLQQQKQKVKQKEETNKKLEFMVDERTKELKNKNQEVLTMMEKLQETQEELVQKEKMASLGGLVAGIAHEVNTPIGVCVTGISHLKHQYQLLLKKIENETATDEDLNDFFEDVSECCDIITANTGKAASIIRSFKSIAVDQSSEDMRSINLKAYLDEVLLSMKPVLKKLPHEISIDCPDNINIDTIAGSLSQVVCNLINNSIIHGFNEEEAGHIHIQAHDTDDTYTLIYSDNGKGMSQEQLNNYFEPFYTSKRGQGGSGLGGHIIFNLVTGKLKGKLALDSQPNDGFSITFKLPKAL